MPESGATLDQKTLLPTAMPEFHQRVAVLHEMEYISPDDTVAVKGRVACEINSGDEIVATEMIFAGMCSIRKSTKVGISLHVSDLNTAMKNKLLNKLYDWHFCYFSFTQFFGKK